MGVIVRERRQTQPKPRHASLISFLPPGPSVMTIPKVNACGLCLPAAGLKILEFRGFLRAEEVLHSVFCAEISGLAGFRRTALPRARRRARARRGFARRRRIGARFPAPQ